MNNSNSWKPKPNQQTAPMKVTPDLRAKFQLPAQPVNVEKIANLAKGRALASMDEITEIISTDSGVTQRLISMAYPKKEARTGATVQMATSRLGVNRVIVVMVGDLLTKAVLETFETMVGIPLEVEADTAMGMADHGFLTGSVRFSGESNGLVTLAFSPHFSLMLAGRLLGGDMDEHSPEAINDVIGELVNIITGSLQSKLCDAGLSSEVGLPQVSFQQTLPEESVPGGSNDQFFFRHGMHTIIVCLSIDPSAQPVVESPAPRAPTTHGNVWRANRP
jgi:CheY-specific phosphatase CheX